jgi:hypothetical protein
MTFFFYTVVQCDFLVDYVVLHVESLLVCLDTTHLVVASDVRSSGGVELTSDA